MLRALIACVALAACTHTNTVQCGSVTCPAGTHCGPNDECVPNLCGNDRVDNLEECDGSVDVENVRCTDYGFYKGPPLTCSDTCLVDTSACSEFCGDHLINGTERCDGIPATGSVCADFGYDVGTIGCTDGCTPAFDFCTNIGWQLVPSSATDELYSVYLASAESGVAVGRGGQIIAAKDGIWVPIASPTTQDLNGVYGNGPTIIAVGNGGTIVLYDGTTTSLMTSPTTEHLLGISGTAQGALAVGTNGTILKYDGTSWTKMTSPVGVALTAVHMIGAGSAYAVGAAGTVLKLTGTTWTKLTITGLPTEALYAVDVVPATAGDAVFVAGDKTTIARIVNDSTAVPPPQLPASVDPVTPVRAMWGTSANDLFIAGGNGTVMHWNGVLLTAQDTPTNRTIYGLMGSNNRIVGVTRGGSVIAFNGTSRHIETNYAAELNAIYTDSPQVVVAAGDQQIIRLATSGPNAGLWQQEVVTGIVFGSVFPLNGFVYAGVLQTPGLYKSDGDGTPQQVLTAGVNAVWGTATPLRVIAVGDKVWESTDGTTFPGSPSSVVNGSNTLYSVWASPDAVWYAVGDNGLAMRRAPGATDWTPIPTGVTNRLLGVWGAASDDVFAVGDHGVVVHWNGTSWRRMYTGIAENLKTISGNSGSDVFAVGTGFTRMHYDGINWSRMASNGFDGAGVSAYRGNTYFVSGGRIERFSRETTVQESRCGDAFDNDSDGRTNCDDPECVEDAQCRRGGACETLERVSCETTSLAATTYTGIARLNDLPCLTHSTPGPEASFRYVAETSGSVTVTVTDTTNQLDLLVTDAMLGHCVLDSCEAATKTGTTQSVTFTATAGNSYFIVVDGPVGVGAPFELSVTCN